MFRSLKSFLNSVAVVAVSAAAAVTPSAAVAADFTAGNLAVFMSSSSANNTTGSILEFNKTSANQTAAQTISIPGTGSNALRFSGSATSTGYLSSTADRSLLTFTGANSSNTTANVNALNPRGVGTLDQTGTYALQATYNGTSSNQARSATSLNNSTWWISDTGGIYTNNATSASPSGNTRGIKTFGGTVYALQASGTAGTAVVATVSAASGGSITNLPGLSNNSTAADFYLISSGSNGATFDILYVSTSTASAGIQKYSLVSGNWTASGTANVTGLGIFGLAAEKNGSGATLFGTTGTGASSANSLLRMVDSAGWNANISLGSPTTLATTASGNTFKGVEFVPVPEPATLCLAAAGVALAGLGAWRRRRTRSAVQTG